ncbi:sulfurtransferase complex subunit TusB [Aliikangiella sp. IMCC44632]
MPLSSKSKMHYQLHIVSTSLTQCELQSFRKRLFEAQDQIVFIGDGVNNLVNTSTANMIATIDAPKFAIANDVKCRGFNTLLATTAVSCELIDYKKLVKLTIESRKNISW